MQTGRGRGRPRGRGRGRGQAQASAVAAAHAEAMGMAMPSTRRGRGRAAAGGSGGGFANTFGRQPSAFDQKFMHVNTAPQSTMYTEALSSDSSSDDDRYKSDQLVVKNELPQRASLGNYIQKQYHPSQFPQDVVSQARSEFPEFDAAKVKHECAILAAKYKKRLPKTVQKLQKRYLKSLGPLSTEQWQFAINDMT